MKTIFSLFLGFHSINVPSEWGLKESHLPSLSRRNVSIQLMSPASGDSELIQIISKVGDRFHSINVPSEWGPREAYLQEQERFVSIQLMSPASGDYSYIRSLEKDPTKWESFHSINVPSEWGHDQDLTEILTRMNMFPFN